MLNHRVNIDLGPAHATATASRSTNPLLHIRLSAGYSGKPHVLRDVTLTIEEGEIVGLIGESGSGKSTLALSILGLLELKGGTTHGEVILCGRHLERLARREMQQIRGREIALVSQSALASLNPALRIGTQFAEAWKAHRRGPGRSWKQTVCEILERFGLPGDERFLSHYPRQLSVGQAQRALIAMAVLHRPRLLIADEPTSALDPITRAEVIDLLKDLNREKNMAVLFISHDLLLVASLCKSVAILKKGEIVESGPVAKIFSSPEHCYTQALLRALPVKVPISVLGASGSNRPGTYVADFSAGGSGGRTRGDRN
jgi:ABC-type dipeptide/oligopeptide/nickel transport system ATPase component